MGSPSGGRHPAAPARGEFAKAGRREVTAFRVGCRGGTAGRGTSLLARDELRGWAARQGGRAKEMGRVGLGFGAVRRWWFGTRAWQDRNRALQEVGGVRACEGGRGSRCARIPRVRGAKSERGGRGGRGRPS